VFGYYAYVPLLLLLKRKMIQVVEFIKNKVKGGTRKTSPSATTTTPPITVTTTTTTTTTQGADLKSVVGSALEAVGVDATKIEGELLIAQSLFEGSAIAHHMEPLYFVGLER